MLSMQDPRARKTLYSSCEPSARRARMEGATPAASANDDRKPAIVTARKPGHQRRGDAADALWRDLGAARARGMMPVRFQQRLWEAGQAKSRRPGRFRPSRWGNPFKVKDHGQRGAVDMHRAVLLGDQAKAKRVLGYDQAGVRHWLRGRPLGCYCPLHQPCHADTLLAVANG